MVPELPVESRVNKKKTLTSDDPDNESVMEHKFPWQEALGPARNMSMGPCSPIHEEKAVNGWDTDIKRLVASKSSILPPFVPPGKL